MTAATRYVRKPWRWEGLASCARVGKSWMIHAHWRGDLSADDAPLTLCGRLASELAGDFVFRVAMPFGSCRQCESVWCDLTHGHPGRECRVCVAEP